MEENKKIIEKPCEEIIEKINNATKDKIILSGPSSSGKTTTLKYYAQKNRNTIYLNYYDMYYDQGLNEIEYKYYHELIFTKKILEYIQQNNLNYNKNFSVYKELIDRELNNFNAYLATRFYCQTKINLNRTFISGISLNLRNTSNNFPTIIIDHFDLVENSSRRFQELIKSYFYFFDKIIITSNDPDLKTKKREQELENKGYSIIKTTYHKNKKYVEEILSQYFLEWIPNNFFDIKLAKKIKKLLMSIRDERFLNYLINKTNGNIEMMKSILRIYYATNETMYEAIEKVVNVSNEINIKRPKKTLHI